MATDNPLSTESPNPLHGRRFPRVVGRDLNGKERQLPGALSGERNVVVVAFRAEQQAMVDTWAPWCESLGTDDGGFAWYEIPTASLTWAPLRGFIDGGMAAAVDSAGRRRTITVYGDRRRMTEGLCIDDTSTVTVAVVDGEGMVRETVTGPYSLAAAARLEAAIGRIGTMAPEPDSSDEQVFDFDFEDRFKPLLRILGVAPSTSRVVVGNGRLRAYFGPWTLDTPLDNITCVQRTGPYKAHRAIGARGSFADSGVTFGSTTAGGLCVRFREPVPGLLPVAVATHPGATFTVKDPRALEELLLELCELD